jgi:hypothetical protein
MSTPAGRRSERYPLALLDHVVAEPALLRKWALQLKRPSRIPLAVYPGSAEAEQGRDLLAKAIARSGSDLELDTDIRQTVEARLPGYTAIPFNMLKGVLKMSLEEVAWEMTNDADKAA